MSLEDSQEKDGGDQSDSSMDIEEKDMMHQVQEPVTGDNEQSSTRKFH